jgi:uncharacterized membrane protein YphA (DoxX/SURF4 family)
MKKNHIILSWILRILLAIGFLVVGSVKLINNPIPKQIFEAWEFRDGFYLIIGILEFSLAILLLIPKTLKIALIALCIITIGATWIYFSRDQLPHLIKPLISALFLSGIYYFNYGAKRAKQSVTI